MKYLFGRRGVHTGNLGDVIDFARVDNNNPDQSGCLVA